MTKTGVLLQRKPQAEWQNCRIGHCFAYGRHNYIRLETDTDSLAIHGSAERLIFILEELLKRIKSNMPPEPSVRGLTQRVDYDTLTPTQVIDYFKHSPVLRQHAADVEAVLAPLVIEEIDSDYDLVSRTLDVSELLKPDGEPAWGARAKIARALGIQDAGGYRKRIDRVFDDLGRSRNSTTTGKGGRFAERGAA